MLFGRTLSVLRLKNRIQCRGFKSDTDMLMFATLLKALNKRKEKVETPVEAGSTRYWNLTNSRSRYFCGGATGPADLEDFSENKVDLGALIDFKNRDYNKLHIDVTKCPKLLRNRLITAFPFRQIKYEEIFIIKLSYEYYLDQKKGQLDCLIAANDICKQLVDIGEWGYYSGAAVKNQDNGILFYYSHTSELTSNDTATRGLHVNVDYKNDCLNINDLSENEVGIIYTNCAIDQLKLKLNIKGFTKKH